ncbi:MAG: T9SS type A sorting domain-containing protein [Rubricoccaceae bacterium]|nr:T9SS type A sorting domain-containing protein [Rubricoccaceae bacterium]
MRLLHLRTLCAVTALLVTAAPLSAQVTNGQSDDFNDGTAMDWRNGRAPSAITNVDGGGPGGPFDRYLRIISDGSGPGGKLVVFNQNQWAGDYIAAGVTTLRMDLDNQGATELTIRLWLEGPGGRFVSTTPVILPPGSGWQAAVFSVAPGDLTPDSGATDVNATLAAVSKLRIYHGPQPMTPGPNIVATLGIDNITAGPFVPNFDLEAAPTSSLTVSPGGSVSFDYAITNNTAAPVTGDLFFTVSPGSVSGLIRSGTLPAGATLTGSLVQPIPGFVPPGAYLYTLRIGQFSGATLDSETFLVRVVPAPRQAGPFGDWAAVEATPWSAAATGSVAGVTLGTARPNPASGRTALAFELPETRVVHLAVYDVLGREVAVLAEGPMAAGRHEAAFDVADLPAGVYLVRLTAGSEVVSQRVTRAR